MKKSYLLPIFIFLCHTIWAQSENDIVRYSVTPNNGSARVSAMGGAFGALGGDLSNTNNNPAGIGVFRRSEVNFTPYFNIANTTSNGISIGKTHSKWVIWEWLPLFIFPMQIGEDIVLV